MKIGVFDSGLGGLLITNSLVSQLPDFSYVYLGDSARVPYGNRSREVIYEFTRDAVDFLFKQDCQIIIIACNTASSEALRKIQQEYLPQTYPDRRVLGVLVPAVEEALETTTNKKVGVLATPGTVKSQAFVSEITKREPEIEVIQQAAPLLTPMIENDGTKFIDPVLDEYLQPLLEAGVDSLILGCTHYPYLKEQIRAKVGEGVKVISQDEFIPAKLKSYLKNHPEIAEKLDTTPSAEYLLTDITQGNQKLSEQFFGHQLDFKRVSL